MNSKTPTSNEPRPKAGDIIPGSYPGTQVRVREVYVDPHPGLFVEPADEQSEAVYEREERFLYALADVVAADAALLTEEDGEEGVRALGVEGFVDALVAERRHQIRGACYDVAEELLDSPDAGRCRALRPAAAQPSEPYWTKDGPWEQRYDEMVTAVYGAAYRVLEKWQVDIGPEIEGLIDQGLGDDVWDWLVGRVPALVRDVYVSQGDEAKAERIAERIAQDIA